MKILLIGHSIIDHFEEAGNQTSKPGGIFYSALGILSLIKAEDKIFILTSWNKKSYNLFQKVFMKTDFSFANEVDEMPEVILKTSGEEEREEVYRNLSAQLSIDRVNNWNQFDGILINMITGFDISLKQLQTIRSNFTGQIYLDVHTLSRGVDTNLKREFRPIPNTVEWLDNIDILQCNERELRTIVSCENELECAKQILGSRVKMLIVTKGEYGARVYFLERNKLSLLFIAAEKIKTVNKVGCGDIFGAVFFYSYISTRDVYKSLKLANKAGAIAASHADLTNSVEFKLDD